MIHTIKIDDSSPTCKRIINDLRKHPKVVKFEETVFTGDVSDGYLTGEEFFAGIKKELNKRSLENSSF